MPPQETDSLLPSSSSALHIRTKESFSEGEERNVSRRWYRWGIGIVFALGMTYGVLRWHSSFFRQRRAIPRDNHINSSVIEDTDEWLKTGSYRLAQVQEGANVADFYQFYSGNDTLGSAGFNIYVNQSRALQQGLLQIVPSPNPADDPREVIRLQSASPSSYGGPRSSLRLEGHARWNSGLFILDVDHVPAGCGQWPAFWLTDTDHWPDHGEIDFVEGINTQSVVKTALHTSDRCSMYAHVPSYAMTGQWDRATGIPDTFTGLLDNTTNVPADNCHVLAPHQWMNQGCVIQSVEEDTLGPGFNQRGGGVFVLQWDPLVTHSIQSWVFPKSGPIPENLRDSIQSASASWGHHPQHAVDQSSSSQRPPIAPDPQSWNVLPYGYFAIGNTTGCSADHFSNMNLILNLAFCGNVAGNRFFMDCPEMRTATTAADPIQACNEYISSEPKDLEEAYFAIRGVYAYERSVIK
jgi:Glycosyl hydrolases family 16